MIICGIKVSHDGGVACIDGNRLLFNVEVEKLVGGRRYDPLGDLNRVEQILRAEGVDPRDVDQFVVDGWEVPPGSETPAVATAIGGQQLLLPVAPYEEHETANDLLRRFTFDGAVPGAHGRIPGWASSYVSYHHSANHAMAAYCTSPFAARNESSLVLVWDGGMSPRVYHVSPDDFAVTPVARLFGMVGNIYPDFCRYFRAFQSKATGLSEDAKMRQYLEVSGKAMAYAALGSVKEDVFAYFDDLYERSGPITRGNIHAFGDSVAADRDGLLAGLSDADVIATFQAYVGGLLVRSLEKLVRRHFPGRPLNLCMGGGSSLNIKWNSAIRESGLFREIWIPPFPNDSGAALGTACCEMFRQGRQRSLDWDVYSGPALDTSQAPPGWSAERCDERQLARILHEENEPVVVLSGRAELGPRALGNRSIIAPAVDAAMKARLNHIKGRDDYRPVAPICLESRAREVFTPGGSDRYMLFEHRLRPGWAGRIPAIVHLDGSARLQTIPETMANPIARVLVEYERISGVPVLCNTSANASGRGFFPNLLEAAAWGRTRYVWADGTLFRNPVDPA